MPKEFPGNLNLFYLYSLRMLFVKIKPANTWAAIHLQNKEIPSQPSKPRENKLFWIKYAQYFIRLRIKYVRYVSFNYENKWPLITPQLLGETGKAEHEVPSKAQSAISHHTS